MQLAEPPPRSLRRPSGRTAPTTALFASDRWSSKDLSVLQGCWYLVEKHLPWCVGFGLVPTEMENCTAKVGGSASMPVVTVDASKR